MKDGLKKMIKNSVGLVIGISWTYIGYWMYDNITAVFLYIQNYIISAEYMFTAGAMYAFGILLMFSSVKRITYDLFKKSNLAHSSQVRQK